MSATENRVGFGSVFAGVLVSLAISAMLVALGVALAGSFSIGLDPGSFLAHRELIALWLIAALVAGAFLGGRSAAVSARLIVRRDGALAGLLAWALLAIVLVAVGTAWAAANPTLAWRLSEDLGAVAWAAFATLAVGLVAALLGGVAGARAEAKSIGLRTVHVAKRGFVTAPDSYERDFFGSASLSSSHSTAP